MPPLEKKYAPPPVVAFRLAMHATLHGKHDSVLHEPVPKELLIAAGEGSAEWGALREDWGKAERPGR